MEELELSVSQFSRSVVSDSLWPHGLQYTRPPCPSPTPRAHSNSHPSSQWCHPTMSSSVVPFSFCLQSFPASGPFPMSQFFTSGGQSIGVSASASVLPMNTQDWFPFRRTGWISLLSKGLSRVFFSTTVQKHQFKDLKDGGRRGPATNYQHCGRAPGSHQAQPGRASLCEDEKWQRALRQVTCLWSAFKYDIGRCGRNCDNYRNWWRNIWRDI